MTRERIIASSFLLLTEKSVFATYLSLNRD